MISCSHTVCVDGSAGFQGFFLTVIWFLSVQKPPPDQTSEPFICLSKYMSQTIKSHVSVLSQIVITALMVIVFGKRVVWSAVCLFKSRYQLGCDFRCKTRLICSCVSVCDDFMMSIEHIIMESSFSAVRMLQSLGFLCVWVCVYSSNQMNVVFSVRLNVGFLGDWMSVRPDRNFPCTLTVSCPRNLMKHQALEESKLNKKIKYLFIYKIFIQNIIWINNF